MLDLGFEPRPIAVAQPIEPPLSSSKLQELLLQFLVFALLRTCLLFIGIAFHLVPHFRLVRPFDRPILETFF